MNINTTILKTNPNTTIIEIYITFFGPIKFKISPVQNKPGILFYTLSN